MMINCRLSKLTVSSSSLIRADIAFCYFLALNFILNGFVKYNKCALKRVSSTTLLIWINCRCVHCFLFESQTVHFITGDRLLNVNSVQLIVKAPHFIARSKVSHSSCVLDLFMVLYIIWRVFALNKLWLRETNCLLPHSLPAFVLVVRSVFVHRVLFHTYSLENLWFKYEIVVLYVCVCVVDCISAYTNINQIQTRSLDDVYICIYILY